MIGTSAPFPTYITYVGDRMVDSVPSARRGLLRSLARLTPIAVAAALLTLIALVVVRAWGSYDQPLWVAIPIQLVGLPFVLGGTILWVQRAGSFLGPFCVFLGGVWYLGDLQAFDQELLFVVGFTFYHLNVVVFAHLALMVPNGRLVGRLDRLVVIALYVVVPVTQFLRYLEIRPYLDRSTFGNVTDDYSTWARVATYVGAPLAAAAAALVVVHYRRAIRAQRRSFGVFWIAAAAAGGAAVAAAGLESWRAELPQQIALLGYALALMAAAVGLVLGAVNITAPARDAWRNLAGDVDDLEQAIATALGDPGLRLYAWADGAWARDGQGPERDPLTDREHAWTILFLAGEPAALLVHDRELAYQRLLMQAVTAMTVAAIARRRLDESSKWAVLDGQHAERARISRDLHDDTQTPLAIVIRGITGIAGQLPGNRPVENSLRTLAQEAVDLQSRLRQIVNDVFPAGLRHDGLAGAIATRVRSLGLNDDDIEVVIDIPFHSSDQRWPERIELAAYFLISEALQNAIKHSGGSTVWISVEETAGDLRIRIDDDGQGLPPAGHGARGKGLANMSARVEPFNGSVEISRSPRGGVRVAALLPLPRGGERSGGA
ncbi:MAG: sensor histidine kinase [Pseudonocardiales bacterium]